MRPTIIALLASAPVALASETVFSVHDDLLAFPQYEVIISDNFISNSDANLIIQQTSSATGNSAQSPNVRSLETQGQSHAPNHNSHTNNAFDPARETYELMRSNGEEHLCIIPIVKSAIKNETSEADARANEQKELARATDRGWELLQDLEGNCLYFVSGWWSYSFCYNDEIVQFHQLTPQAGKSPYPPQRDPLTKQFVLGRAKASQGKEDEWGSQVDVRKGRKSVEPPKTELQVKGDTRYLVQKMDGGTVCDLTRKPRHVEVQYHCNPHVADRIGYIKEITTCTYLMVVYTPRLCKDVVFMPPKESKAHAIVCRPVVPDDELAYRSGLRSLEGDSNAKNSKADKPVNIGGVIVGGGQWVNKEGQRMPVPANFGLENQGKVVEIVARAQSKADGGLVEVASDADLKKMDIDPKVVHKLRMELQQIARENGWQIKVVDSPGQIREILGVVEEDDDEAESAQGSGSEEIYKDEL